MWNFKYQDDEVEPKSLDVADWASDSPSKSVGVGEHVVDVSLSKQLVALSSVENEFYASQLQLVDVFEKLRMDQIPNVLSDRMEIRSSEQNQEGM